MRYPTNAASTQPGFAFTTALLRSGRSVFQRSKPSSRTLRPSLNHSDDHHFVGCAVSLPAAMLTTPPRRRPCADRQRLRRPLPADAPLGLQPWPAPLSQHGPAAQAPGASAALSLARPPTAVAPIAH